MVGSTQNEIDIITQQPTLQYIHDEISNYYQTATLEIGKSTLATINNSTSIAASYNDDSLAVRIGYVCLGVIIGMPFTFIILCLINCIRIKIKMAKRKRNSPIYRSRVLRTIDGRECIAMADV